MLLACLLCAALGGHPPEGAVLVQQHMFPVPGAYPSLTPNQTMAMQLYQSEIASGAETAVQAFQAAAEASGKGFGLLAQQEMQMARHGVANAMIAQAELISGQAAIHHAHDAAAAAYAEWCGRMQQEEKQARARAGNPAADPAHKQLYAIMAEDLARIETDPGRYSRPGGADALAYEHAAAGQPHS